MRIHFFLCNNDTHGECIQRQLFGTNKSKMLAGLHVGDLAVLYHVPPTRIVYGLWEIVKADRDLVPEAWKGKYPVQARVRQVTKDIVEKPYDEVKELLLDGTRMRDMYDGDDAEALAKVFGPILPTPIPTVAAVPSPHPDKYHVPFFDEMLHTGEWQIFEDDTHSLLRLLGIINLHEIPRAMQAGRSDGYFKIGRLAVIYDATLNESHAEFKAQQVENYIHQLEADVIKLPRSRTENVKDCKKRVWIITRGTTAFHRRDGEVQVSEVGISDLIHLYKDRLTKKLDAEQLEDALAKLGS